MILLLRSDATDEQVRGIVESVEALGLQPVVLDAGKGRAIEVLGEDRGRALALASAPGVGQILTRRVPLDHGEPLWPHFALRAGILALVLVTALGFLSVFLRPGLGDRAAGAETYEPASRVEWYLRPLAAWFGIFPAGLHGVAGIVLLLALVLFLAWPFVDRADPATPRGRLLSIAIRAAGALVLVLSLVAMLGGPR